MYTAGYVFDRRGKMAYCQGTHEERSFPLASCADRNILTNSQCRVLLLNFASTMMNSESPVCPPMLSTLDNDS